MPQVVETVESTKIPTVITVNEYGKRLQKCTPATLDRIQELIAEISARKARLPWQLIEHLGYESLGWYRLSEEHPSPDSDITFAGMPRGWNADRSENPLQNALGVVFIPKMEMMEENGKASKYVMPCVQISGLWKDPSDALRTVGVFYNTSNLCQANKIEVSVAEDEVPPGCPQISVFPDDPANLVSAFAAIYTKAMLESIRRERTAILTAYSDAFGNRPFKFPLPEVSGKYVTLPRESATEEVIGIAYGSLSNPWILTLPRSLAIAKNHSILENM